MKYTLATVTILIVMLVNIGCASVISGTEDRISVNSLEDGTIIKVDGQPRGKDSAEVHVRRGKPHVIIASKPGCKDTAITTGRDFDYRSLLGILIDFGLITIPIDFISGAVWKTEPSSYTVTPNCNSS